MDDSLSPGRVSGSCQAFGGACRRCAGAGSAIPRQTRAICPAFSCLALLCHVGREVFETSLRDFPLAQTQGTGK